MKLLQRISNSINPLEPMVDGQVERRVFLGALVSLAAAAAMPSDASVIRADAITLQDYPALRAYRGQAELVQIVGTLIRRVPEGIVGEFRRFDGTIGAPDDGGTVIVDALDRRWMRTFEGAVYVGWFGAQADGVADDTAALVKAAASINASSGGILDLGEGKYAGDSLTCLNFSNCKKPVIVHGKGAKLYGRLSTSACLSVSVVGVTITTLKPDFPAYARFENTKRVELKESKFAGVTVYVTPSATPYSTESCPCDFVGVAACTFSGNGAQGSGDGARHLYIRSAKKILIEDNEFLGESMHEFMKITEFSGQTDVSRNRFRGSCKEELLDAFTAYGPIYLTDNEGDLTSGSFYTHKASGNSGSLLRVAMPVHVSITGNKIRSMSKALVYCGGARGLPWERAAQSVLLKDNILLGGDGAGAGYNCVDIRGTHVVDVIDNPSIGWMVAYEKYMSAIYSVGNGMVTIEGNRLPIGSIVVAQGKTTTGESYGSTAALDIHDNKIESALAAGGITISKGQDSLEFKAFRNIITINHSFAISTRPIFFDGPIRSYFAEENEARKLGRSGELTPIFSAGLPERAISRNGWDRH